MPQVRALDPGGRVAGVATGSVRHAALLVAHGAGVGGVGVGTGVCWLPAEEADGSEAGLPGLVKGGLEDAGNRLTELRRPLLDERRQHGVHQGCTLP